MVATHTLHKLCTSTAERKLGTHFELEIRSKLLSQGFRRANWAMESELLLSCYKTLAGSSPAVPIYTPRHHARASA